MNTRSMMPVVAVSSITDEAAARKLSHALIDERLAACVQIVPGIRSVYRWQGVVHDDTECQVWIKTTRERIDALKVRLRELHPYDTPELLVFDAVDGLERYVRWVQQETKDIP